MVTEGAFGKLKGRWRILSKKCESSKEVVKRITLACVVLHNVCIERGDIIPRRLDLTLDPVTNKRRPRHDLREVLQMTDIAVQYFGNKTKESKSVRDCIANKFFEEKQNYEKN